MGSENCQIPSGNGGAATESGRGFSNSHKGPNSWTSAGVPMAAAQLRRRRQTRSPCRATAPAPVPLVRRRFRQTARGIRDTRRRGVRAKRAPVHAKEEGEGEGGGPKGPQPARAVSHGTSPKTRKSDKGDVGNTPLAGFSFFRSAHG